MPYKSESIKLPKEFDRRIKLTEQQRQEIYIRYHSSTVGTRPLAKEYGVSRTLIMDIVNPERACYRREQARRRRADGRYKPTKEKWNETMREHRRYKQKLYTDGLIK